MSWWLDRKLPITIDTWTVTGFLHKWPIIKEFGQLLSDEMSNIDNPDYDGYEECSFFSSIFLYFWSLLNSRTGNRSQSPVSFLKRRDSNDIGKGVIHKRVSEHTFQIKPNVSQPNISPKPNRLHLFRTYTYPWIAYVPRIRIKSFSHDYNEPKRGHWRYYAQFKYAGRKWLRNHQRYIM